MVLLLCQIPIRAVSQERRVMNRPYIDDRIWHYGFLLGLNWQDIHILNSGVAYVNSGTLEEWYADVDSYSPGFSVGILGSMRISDNLSLRLIPTMHFGDKSVIFKEQLGGRSQRQVLKSTYLSLPINVKIAPLRYNNYRPYLVTGVAPTVDLTVKKHKELLLKRYDCIYEIGLGMDLYYPYFKLIPELKFCFGLSDIINKERDDIDDRDLKKYTNAVYRGYNRMIVLTLYFE